MGNRLSGTSRPPAGQEQEPHLHTSDAPAVNPPDRLVIAIVGPLGAGATFVQKQLLRGFEILREKEYEPTIGYGDLFYFTSKNSF